MVKMTMRDRMMAVIQGKELDRIPFVQYEDLSAPAEEIWSVLGRDKMGLLSWSCIYGGATPNCSVTSEEIYRNDIKGSRSILHTPVGELVEERFFEPTYGAKHIEKHYVVEPEDYKVLAACLRDTELFEATEQFYNTQQALGEDGLPHVVVDRTPYQQLWVQWVSLEDLAWHLVECPELVEECVSLMVRNARKSFEIVRNVPVPYVVFPDNITAPAIGEKYFRKYCLPLYNEMADMLSDKKIPVFVHMDGDLKPLWKAIAESKLGGIESLSPPPDNDTSIADALAMWPHIRVCPNFPSSVHLAEPEVIYEQASKILEEGGHSGRLWIQISENVPPGVWRKSYPQIAKAIEDFGKP